MEEGSGLESLINQRLTRPSYTRMVSWEFSNQQEAIPVKRQRRRSKKQSDVDEEVDILVFSSDEEQDGHSSLTESDEDCLYFSAEETISLESDSANKIHQKIASLDIDETSDKDTTLGDEDDDSLAGVQSPPQKKHAPSKKQKRKRRKSKNSYVFYAGDFLSGMEINVEPDIIFDTQELVEESRIYVEKAVPSLVELCLNCTRRRKPNIQLPKGLKNMVKHSNKEFTFRKFQVSWLQNEFSKWQPFEKKKTELFFAVYAEDGEWGSDPVYTCLLATRNIWNNVFYPRHLFSRYLNEYDGSKTSSFLPFTFVTNPNAWENNYDGIKYIFQQRFLGCLANLVDLMMPSILSERKAGTESDRYKSELDQISATTKTAMMRVKGALSVRFRDITDLFFDKIIPYVFWARGDFHLAANLFAKLIEGEKTQ
ncbi:uncharacterized protein [Argopecten irradians]|uniref:uncharacterized protein n=1 Tax=Argopecten irradians TaxID=31199 RepID=UPI003715D2CF